MSGSAVAFPALTRAKQRFLRRPKAHRDGHEGQKKQKGRDARVTEITIRLERLGKQLDCDLNSIECDVDCAHDYVAQRRIDVVDAVDAFCTSLTELEGNIRATITHEPRNSRQKSVHFFSPGNQEEKRSVTFAQASNRVTQLAAKAANAMLLQRWFRRQLYTRLYPGGAEAFRTSFRLRQQVQQRQKWVKWITYVKYKHHMRQRFQCLHDISLQEVGTRCRMGAARVLAEDGMYGVAKEFHRLRILGKAWIAWLNVSRSSIAHPYE